MNFLYHNTRCSIPVLDDTIEISGDYLGSLSGMPCTRNNR